MLRAIGLYLSSYLHIYLYYLVDQASCRLRDTIPAVQKLWLRFVESPIGWFSAFSCSGPRRRRCRREACGLEGVLDFEHGREIALDEAVVLFDALQRGEPDAGAFGEVLVDRPRASR
jgi:hypothetical protein